MLTMLPHLVLMLVLQLQVSVGAITAMGWCGHWDQHHPRLILYTLVPVKWSLVN
jgi:hypothetical protein